MGHLCVRLTIFIAFLVGFSSTLPRIAKKTHDYNELPEILTRDVDRPKRDTHGRVSRSAMQVILEENADVLKEGDSILLEGDIYLGKDAAYNALRDPKKRWTNGVVPYEIDESIDTVKRKLIMETFAHYHERTCIKFVEHSDEEDYVVFIRGKGCWSSVGRDGGRQEISIGNGCETLGTVIHEIMHAMGFFHEQSRTDRDDYITIKWENIDDDMEYNFDKYDHTLIDPLGAPYDYRSVMHYDSTSFSTNGQATIVPKQPDVGLVDRDYFSKWDLFKLNKLYDCGMTGLEHKLLPGSGECFLNPKAVDYRGTVSTTKTGKTCKNWFTETAYGQGDDGRLTWIEYGLGDHNYCRNPDGDSLGSWCYVVGDQSYDYCDVGTPGDQCAVTSPVTPFPTVAAATSSTSSECYRLSDGSDYRGVVSTTRGGETCHVWSFGDYSLGADDQNYCRNPDSDAGPWCYTDFGYGYCDVGQPNENC